MTAHSHEKKQQQKKKKAQRKRQLLQCGRLGSHREERELGALVFQNHFLFRFFFFCFEALGAAAADRAGVGARTKTVSRKKKVK